MTALAIQSTDRALFRDEPGHSLIYAAHRKICVAIRQILVNAGLVIEVWTVVVNVYLIATQGWGSYYRMKVMQHVDDMLEPWLAKSKQIGQTEEEQAALMDEMFSEWGKEDPRFLQLVGFNPKSIKENGMALNADDLEKIKALLNNAEQGFTPAWKQTAAICFTIAVFAIASVSWWTIQLNRLDDKVDNKVASKELVDGKFALLNQRLDFMGVPKSPAAPAATSTDTR